MLYANPYETMAEMKPFLVIMVVHSALCFGVRGGRGPWHPRAVAEFLESSPKHPLPMLPGSAPIGL